MMKKSLLTIIIVLACVFSNTFASPFVINYGNFPTNVFMDETKNFNFEIEGLGSIKWKLQEFNQDTVITILTNGTNWETTNKIKLEYKFIPSLLNSKFRFVVRRYEEGLENVDTSNTIETIKTSFSWVEMNTFNYWRSTSIQLKTNNPYLDPNRVVVNMYIQNVDFNYITKLNKLNISGDTLYTYNAFVDNVGNIYFKAFYLKDTINSNLFRIGYNDIDKILTDSLKQLEQLRNQNTDLLVQISKSEFYKEDLTFISKQKDTNGLWTSNWDFDHTFKTNEGQNVREGINKFVLTTNTQKTLIENQNYQIVYLNNIIDSLIEITPIIIKDTLKVYVTWMDGTTDVLDHNISEIKNNYSFDGLKTSLNINYSKMNLDNKLPFMFKIFDVNGDLKYESKSWFLNIDTINFDQLSSGNYFFVFYTEGKRETQWIFVTVM